ncbi:hypothetical protein LIG30_2182 [Burkholderia sp. lig30]|jgi:hypothetical protein|uniref:hypothetical protein n=1 Tax=Burkholderia sp. lig30 TaxID=1192124 RepID=UPI000461EBF0|nr:hypothetical protein [Burkholderia sp. lig30]KDB08724.1 hypothetical protein LIG30_2182 [Burkholderia sp. lig30]
MVSLNRIILKVALFIGLLALSLRYVRPYPYEWTEIQMRTWLHTSQALGIRDPEDLYFVVWVTIELIVAVLAYIAVMWVWRYYRWKKHVEK